MAHIAAYSFKSNSPLTSLMSGVVLFTGGFVTPSRHCSCLFDIRKKYKNELNHLKKATDEIGTLLRNRCSLLSSNGSTWHAVVFVVITPIEFSKQTRDQELRCKTWSSRFKTSTKNVFSLCSCVSQTPVALLPSAGASCAALTPTPPVRHRAQAPLHRAAHLVDAAEASAAVAATVHDARRRARHAGPQTVSCPREGQGEGAYTCQPRPRKIGCSGSNWMQWQALSDTEHAQVPPHETVSCLR